MWVTELKLSESIDIGPGVVKMMLSGITPDSAFVIYEIGGSELTCQIGLEKSVKLNNNVKVRLMKCKKAKAVFGFEAPPDVKFVQEDRCPSTPSSA